MADRHLLGRWWRWLLRRLRRQPVGGAGFGRPGPPPAGVREPRRPRSPVGTGARALPLPPDPPE